MKTNRGWIKTDYCVQTLIGRLIFLLIIWAVCCLLLGVAGFDKGFSYIFLPISLVLVFLIPLGIWQVISGIVSAFDNDRLQQIYVSVVIVYFSIWYFIAPFSIEFYFMLAIAIIIAVWKYTVVRADYISLAIIDMPKESENDALDA
jgi:hypothetical protein